MAINPNLTLSDLSTDLHLHIAPFCRRNDRFALGAANRTLYNSLYDGRFKIITQSKRVHLNALTLGTTVTEALTFMHDNGSDLSIDERGKAVKRAAKKGHPEIVEALLANGPISKEHRGLAVWWAICFDHLEIVQALLANGSISEEDRDDAVETAVKLKLPEIVQALQSASAF